MCSTLICVTMIGTLGPARQLAGDTGRHLPHPKHLSLPFFSLLLVFGAQQEYYRKKHLSKRICLQSSNSYAIDIMEVLFFLLLMCCEKIHTHVHSPQPPHKVHDCVNSLG